MKFTTLSTVAVLVLGTIASAAPTGQTKAQNYIIQLDKSAVVEDCKEKTKKKKRQNKKIMNYNISCNLFTNIKYRIIYSYTKHAHEQNKILCNHCI